MSDSRRPHGLLPTSLLCSQDFPGKNTGLGLLFPSLSDLPDPGVKLVSPAWQADSLPLSHLGSPREGLINHKCGNLFLTRDRSNKSCCFCCLIA